MLPHALAYNAPSIPEVMAILADVLVRTVARGLYDWPDGLAPSATRHAERHRSGDRPGPGESLLNPSILEREPIRDLIARAFRRNRPAPDR